MTSREPSRFRGLRARQVERDLFSRRKSPDLRCSRTRRKTAAARAPVDDVLSLSRRKERGPGGTAGCRRVLAAPRYTRIDGSSQGVAGKAKGIDANGHRPSYMTGDRLSPKCRRRSHRADRSTFLHRSEPGPPSALSMPYPPSTRSSPGPAESRSWPGPPTSVSSSPLAMREFGAASPTSTSGHDALLVFPFSTPTTRAHPSVGKSPHSAAAAASRRRSTRMPGGQANSAQSFPRPPRIRSPAEITPQIELPIAGSRCGRSPPFQ
jgi:hypothetical protein